jgi:hypothetical protein
LHRQGAMWLKRSAKSAERSPRSTETNKKIPNGDLETLSLA